MYLVQSRYSPGRVAAVLLFTFAAAAPVLAQQSSFSFQTGDLVVSVEGDGANTANLPDTTYGDNQAAPITLYQYSPAGTTGASFVSSLQLPQTSSGVNSAISGEYGSSSEGSLELSANGQYLTIMGYGISAGTYNSNPSIYSTACTPTPSCTSALAQSTSLSSASHYIPRVVALISANGSVDTSTSLANVFDGNNPRSVATVDGSSFYISGQGQSGDTTEGLFVAQRGASSATAISTAYDTRNVEIYNGQLFVSQDSKVGSGQLAYIASVGAAGSLPTGATTPSILPGLSTGSKKSADPGTIALSGNGNSVNGGAGSIYLSPENYFFANSTTLYVADGGDPKAGGVGDGGLQKWTLGSGGTWKLDYTLATGLNLVSSVTATSGTTGLFALTGKVVGGNVQLFATNATLGDLDATYLFGISDTLSDTTASQAAGESFTTLATAPADTNFKGVAFAPSAAPVPLPGAFPLLLSGLALFGIARKKGMSRAHP